MIDLSNVHFWGWDGYNFLLRLVVCVFVVLGVRKFFGIKGFGNE